MRKKDKEEKNLRIKWVHEIPTSVEIVSMSNAEQKKKETIIWDSNQKTYKFAI